MQKICIWFLTNSKAFLKKRMFYITVFVMFILCLTIEGLSRDSSKESVGLMLNCEDKGYFEDLKDHLSKDRDVIIYDDFSDIEDALIKDKINLAFVINKTPYDYAIKGIDKGVVDIYTSPGYIYTEVEKEIFYDTWLSCCSDLIIKDESKKIFDGDKNELTEKLINEKNRYLNSDELFDFTLHEYEAQSKENAEDMSVRLVIALSIFVMVFIMSGQQKSGENKSIVNCFSKDQRYIYILISLVSTAFVMGVTGVICISFCSNRGILHELVSMCVFLVFTVIWVYIAGLLLRKETAYITLCPILIILQVIISPVFIDMGTYIPVIKFVKYLFPVTYYMLLI